MIKPSTVWVRPQPITEVVEKVQCCSFLYFTYVEMIISDEKSPLGGRGGWREKDRQTDRQRNGQRETDNH